MNHSTQIRRGTVTALTVILIASAGAAPAVARQDPGAPNSHSTLIKDSGHCPLTRIGTQFVHCDDLTGAGVAAPSWVPES